MAESVVKASVIFDTSQLQEGVQTSVEGLKEMAEQASVTSQTMMTKSQAMAAAAQEAAASVSEADMKMAAATKISVAARADLAKAMRDVKAGAGSEADAITLLAAAQQKARVAGMELAEAQKEIAASVSEPISLGGMAEMGESVLKFGAMLAGAELVGKFKEAASASLEFGEAISRATQKTGLSAEMLSVLHYASATTGGDFDGMSKAVSKLDKNIGEAADGNVKMAALFESLGLNAKELAGNSDGAAIALNRVAAVLSNTEGPRRQQLAMELLGKAGADSIPTLIQVGTNWDNLTQKTRNAGVMLSGETAEALEGTEQRLKDVGEHVDGAKLAFTQGLIPGINQFLTVLAGGGNQMSVFSGLGMRLAGVMNLAAAAAYGLASGLARTAYVMSGPGMFTKNGELLLDHANEWATKAEAFKQAIVEGNKSASTGVPEVKAPRGGTDGQNEGWQGSDKSGGGNAAEAARKASEAKLQAMVEGREKEEREGKLGAKADYEYWVDRLQEFQKGSAQYREVEKRITQDDIELARAAHAAIEKYKTNQTREATEDVGEQERVAHSIAEMNKHLVEQAEDVTRTGERWEPYNKAVAAGAEIAAKQNEAMQELRIKTLEAEGAIRPISAAQALAKIHTEEHTRALQALEAELAKLQAMAANAPKDAVTGQAMVDPKVAAQMQNLQNQIAQEKGSASKQGAQDASAVSSAISKPYLDAFNQINSGWLKVQNDLIQGNARIGRDFREMGLHMVQSMAASAEKMIADWARMELRKMVLHRATATQNNITDAAGAATSDSISAISALKQASHAAAVAAGKAWSAMADIPIVGPELGAVAAATVYAGVMALAAFEKGGVVGGSPGMAVPILAHSGERVLTTQQTTNFERMVNNSSTQGGDAHFHLGGNSFNGGGGDFKQQWAQNERHIQSSLRRMHREGKLNFARG